jgi:hypothetical protein
MVKLRKLFISLFLLLMAAMAGAVKKIFPRRKSKKQRQREKLKQIIDNY